MRTKDLELEITQAAFDKLPALIGRGTFMAWTGFIDEDVSAGVKDGSIQVRRRTPTSRKGKFYKWQLAEICGLKLK